MSNETEHFVVIPAATFAKQVSLLRHPAGVTNEQARDIADRLSRAAMRETRTDLSDIAEVVQLRGADDGVRCEPAWQPEHKTYTGELPEVGTQEWFDWLARLDGVARHEQLNAYYATYTEEKDR